MNYKSIVGFLLFWILPLTSIAQYQKELSLLINADLEHIAKQKQLDHFFEDNVQKMSPQELADCYHDYAYQWCYKQQWKKRNKKFFLDTAITIFQKSATIKRSDSLLKNYSLKRTLYNLGVIYSNKGDFFDAIKAFSEIIEIKEIDKKTINAYRGLAKTYTRIGDFHKALHCFDRLITLSQKKPIHKKQLIQGYVRQAETYALMGYKEHALQIYYNIDKADSLINQWDFKNQSFNNDINQIRGNTLLTTGKDKESLTFFNKVLKGLQINDSIRLAEVYNSIGIAQLHLSNHKEANLNLQKALSYNPNFTPAYENMGDLYCRNNEFRKGLLAYQKAISFCVSTTLQLQYDSLMNQEDLDLAIHKYDLLHHLIQKANAWIQYYHYDKNKEHLIQALRTFSIADRLVDIIRFESSEYKSKLYWREQGASLYIKAVETCYLLNKPEKAYYFMEKNKALLLLEDITNEQAKEYAKLPDHISKREFALKQAIHLSENELNNTQKPSKNTLLFLKNKIYKNKHIYEKFIDSLTQTFPEYSSNKQKIEVLPYELFKKKYISNKEVVLHYILNDRQGFGILTTVGGPTFFKIHDVTTLQEDITTLRKQCSHWFSDQAQLSNFQKKSHHIFKKLIPDIIYSQVQQKNLTILPDYTLQQISFETLTTSPKAHSYLIKDTEIRYTYSMSYLDRTKQIKRTPEFNFMGVAPVTFNSSKLNDLSLSKKEITEISSMLSGNMLLEKYATKANFLDTIHQYKIIHLSTHADANHRTTPWIAFRDTKMFLNEIYATHNQADMIVLSACKTSSGVLKKGEGVMSLARGFFYSGAKSVVSSLWAANDKSNQELMIDFYKGLDQGMTKSTALRNAKLKYIQTHKGSELSPFYWGALVLIGDHKQISLSLPNTTILYVAIIIMIIIVLSIFYIRMRKKASS
ncbi:CHAT domain-containing protein [Aquimarina aquimarini]|uniref:CHAT domain-containing protein n=1 Tax=Aquimarina aquimarini TaxID=1191734 RepID=UPI000D55E6D4|nr:CHAT domain-containing protein [Aquimarina aquimarini]